MTDHTIDVGGYNISFVAGGIRSGQFAASIVRLVPAAWYIVITDDNVKQLYGTEFEASLRAVAGVARVAVLSMPAGEQHKHRHTKEQLEDAMLALACNRDTCIIALGGGVVGDMAGFVAATFVRGIPFVQIPTTLLAVVDASVGGKTAVDTPAGKNLIGAFHQPRGVFVDLTALHTLSTREVCNGFAEIVKIAATNDAELFGLLESHVDELISSTAASIHGELLFRVVGRACALKADVVQQDEREGGIRAILNFGHSIGHAIEALQPSLSTSSQTNSLLHGECVSVGMIAEARLAVARQHSGLSALSHADLDRLIACLNAFHLPTVVPANLSIADIVAKMAVDKKNNGGRKLIVLLNSIGSVVPSKSFTHPISDDEIRILLCPSVKFLPLPATSSSSCVHSPPASQTRSVHVPGSKSLSNRALLLAALGRSECVVRGLLHSEDVRVTVAALRALSVDVEWRDGGRELVVRGCNGQPRLKSSLDVPTLELGNAGTALRFLTALCTLLPVGQCVRLTGCARMRQRPIGDLVEALRSQGCRVDYEGADGYPPLLVHGSCGLRNGGTLHVRAGVSSQFVSALLLAAPHAASRVELRLSADVVSPAFIELTLNTLRQFGVQFVSQTIENCPAFVLEHPVGYQNPSEFCVEGDASTACYALSLGALVDLPDIAQVPCLATAVSNVGAASSQCDAKFATDVLQRMGARVWQTEQSTCVARPLDGTPQALGTICMRDLTDLFITAAALAAVAQGRTIITGVANQRVKECDRIAATVSAVRAIGVEARETADGLEIDGNPNLVVDRPVLIECHNDHRMAMSFAVLAARFPNIIIGDKRCVEKTYPGFWDDMHARFGLDFDANVVTALQPQAPLVEAAPDCVDEEFVEVFDQSNASTATVVLIGMRGAGKSSLGAVLAAASNRVLLDTDALVPLPVGVSSIAELVARDGWPAFRALECDTICKVLNQYKSGGAVIVCGGGAIETPQVREAIAAASESIVVIEIRRNIEDIELDLQSNSLHRPSLGQSLSDIYLHRAPLYAACADAEFNISRGDRDWNRIQAEFLQFTARLLRKTPVTPPPHSFFVCLTAAEYDSMTVEALADICRGCDAVELRADLLACVVNCTDDMSLCLDGVRHAVSVLRRLLPRGMPLIFTVRTLSQGGAFRGSDTALAQLWELGARLAADVIDIEWAWPLEMRLPSLSRARENKIAIIASHHFPHSSGGSQEELMALLQSLSVPVSERNITADVCKLVIRAATMPDVLNLLGLRLRFPADRPLILLAMGAVGQMTRLLNCHWTPCTHPLLRAAAAGQLSVSEIQQLRAQLNMSPFECLNQRSIEFEFAVIGQSPIASVSPSPRTHNAAFRELHLPYRYGAIEASDFDAEPAQWLHHSSALGASVTIPFKERAMRFCVDLSPSARTIGAVNTLIKCPGGYFGDNTDWIGMQRAIQHQLPAECNSALILGAGGTARAAVYAAHAMGFASILIWNRTLERAESIAAELNGVCGNVSTVSDLSQIPMPVQLVISTLPNAAWQLGVAWIPDSLFAAHPVVFDVLYHPKLTALLARARYHGCTLAFGQTMFIEQAIAQFECWMRRSAGAQIRTAMLKAAHLHFGKHAHHSAPSSTK